MTRRGGKVGSVERCAGGGRLGDGRKNRVGWLD